MINFDQKNYFIFGVHATRTAIRFSPDRCKKLFLARKGPGISSLIAEANAHNIPIEYHDKDSLQSRFSVSKDAQGVILKCLPPRVLNISELTELKNLNSVLILDSFQDPANLGRAARAAWCFGIDAMIINKDRSASITPGAEKSAAGAFSVVPVARVSSLVEAIKKLKDLGFFIYGAIEQGTISLHECEFAKKSAFVIGQEGSGMREPVKKACDFLVKIPMSKNAECLNAADTALLFLYQFSCNMKK